MTRGTPSHPLRQVIEIAVLADDTELRTTRDHLHATLDLDGANDSSPPAVITCDDRADPPRPIQAELLSETETAQIENARNLAYQATSPTG